MTAQHAQRQGKAAARNVAATLGHGTRKPYKHRDLGSVVDLGGWQAVANPLHIPLSGPLANVITRGYHLYALPANRLRVATDWLNDIIEHRQFVQLGLIPSEYSGLGSSRAHRHLLPNRRAAPRPPAARINQVNPGDCGAAAATPQTAAAAPPAPPRQAPGRGQASRPHRRQR